MTTAVKQWNGSRPTVCEICKYELVGNFIDGATSRGPWAKMCPHCHYEQGIGLGTGRGQRYDLQTLRKLEG